MGRRKRFYYSYYHPGYTEKKVWLIITSLTPSLQGKGPIPLLGYPEVHQVFLLEYGRQEFPGRLPHISLFPNPFRYMLLPLSLKTSIISIDYALNWLIKYILFFVTDLLLEAGGIVRMLMILMFLRLLGRLCKYLAHNNIKKIVIIIFTISIGIVIVLKFSIYFQGLFSASEYLPYYLNILKLYDALDQREYHLSFE